MKIEFGGGLTVIVTLGGRQNAFIVVGELYKVDTVALTVVGVDFFAALKVVEAHAEVFTAGHQVLAVVAYVHRVYLLLLPPSKENTRK